MNSENKKYISILKEISSMEQLIERIKDPKVQGIVLSKYHISSDSPLLALYIKNKDFDAIDGVLRRINKKEVQKTKLEGLEEEYSKMDSRIFALYEEKERLELEIKKLKNEIGGA